MGRYLKLLGLVPVFLIFISACGMFTSPISAEADHDPTSSQFQEINPEVQENEMSPGNGSAGPGGPPSHSESPSKPENLLPLPAETSAQDLVNLPDTGQTLDPGAYPCLAAELIPDLAQPQAVRLYPGEVFVQVWRLRDTGTCTWLDSSQVQHAGGNAMDGYDGRLLGHALPGETVDVVLSLLAPQEPGEYAGGWLLVSDSGIPFGTGLAGQEQLIAAVEVNLNAPKVSYDLFKNACGASWDSSLGSSSCQEATLGTAVRADGAEQVLFMQTPGNRDGWVKAVFPGYMVRAGDRFRASIGCAMDRPICDVIFQLKAALPEGVERKLGVWRAHRDGSLTENNLDLRSLSQQRVHLELVVWSNGGGE